MPRLLIVWNRVPDLDGWQRSGEPCTIASIRQRDVRLWHLADLPLCTDECQLSGGKADMTRTGRYVG
jgi:hypothetical protein